MAVDQKQVEQLLGTKEKRADNSLRAKSLERALKEKVPTTLTPHEWEQWYEEHGVPEGHQRSDKKAATSWWQWPLGKK